LATQRNYRKLTTKQKVEIVLAGLRGDRSVKDVCREHEIAETLYYSWRDKLLEGGKLAPAPPPAAAPPAPRALLRQPARPALTDGYDLDLGRRGRLVLLERDRRLPDARDPGLGT
jgi:transposase-like protein